VLKLFCPVDGLQQEHGKTKWSELAPTNAPQRMDDKWSKKVICWVFGSLTNHGG